MAAPWEKPMELENSYTQVHGEKAAAGHAQTLHQRLPPSNKATRNPI